jgi:two-component system, sensor histidine kinase
MIDLSDKNVLIVEDDDMNYIYLKQVFKFIKGNISRVKSGLPAIELCKQQHFEVILMDLKLPDISGYEVIREIRKFDLTTPIIVQTASKSPDEHEEAYKSGCNDILVKPFKIDDLTSMLSKVLG